MSVRLVSISCPTLSDAISTAEDLIVYCARVSNPTNQTNMATGSRLLRYCVDHGHWSVFEMASMCVEIHTSRAIGRQMLRHRSFSFQEFSQRYSAAPDTYPALELRLQGKGRQGGDVVASLPAELHADVAAHLTDSMALYRRLLDHGVAAESARMLLPELTQTTMYMHGTVRSWIHYLQQRCTSATQREHRAVAEGIRDVFTQAFPMISAALDWSEA